MSGGGGGRGGLGGWVMDWSKKGVVIGGVTGIAFRPAAAYSLLALIGTGVGIGIAALIIGVGSLVTSVQAADIQWTDSGITIGNKAVGPGTEPSAEKTTG